jgi:hypothetical protein
LRESIGYKIEAAEKVFRDAYLAKLKTLLSDEELARGLEKGHATAPEKAVILAFKEYQIPAEEDSGIAKNIGFSNTLSGIGPGANSIAVLPFAHLSSTPDDEYFCDGLAEELINAMAKIEDLKVAARTSAFSFKGKIRTSARSLAR